jgi:hypothetical protein
MPSQYPNEPTRRDLLALTKAGVINPGSLKEQVAECVAQMRLIYEHAIDAEKAVETGQPRPPRKKNCPHIATHVLPGLWVRVKCEDCGEETLEQ